MLHVAKGSEEDFLKAVVPDMKNGLLHLKETANLLLNCGEEQPMTLKQEILNAKESLQRSEHSATNQLHGLETYCEKLIEKKGKLESQKINQKTELDNLKGECQAINSSLETCRRELQKAKDSHESAQNDLCKYRNQAKKHRESRNICLVLSFTVIGTIPGLIGAAIEQDALERMENKVKYAKKDVDNSRSEVNSFDEKLKTKKQERTKLEKSIEECNVKIRKTSWTLKDLQHKQKHIAQFQVKVQSAVTFLGTLAGRAAAAELYSSKSTILLQPLFKVMEGMMDLLFQTAGQKKHLLMQDLDIQMSKQSLLDLKQRLSEKVCFLTNSEDQDYLDYC
ncbi:hypothetical protein UPYG_G00245160 [Umbra pygmaea]|uniref:Uncharacterized protein n=1 Tax=Umbra pygmaea TaxID=75934 RepID=A0ABD0WLI1_UMBPY